MLGWRITALAMATLCFCPPDSLPPLVPHPVFRPFLRSSTSTLSSSTSSCSSIATLSSPLASVSLEMKPLAFEMPDASIALFTSCSFSPYQILNSTESLNKVGICCTSPICCLRDFRL
mmetsp:Transcript_11860/g.11836  ORF Transcript_11860/g.11836 Transcript_11860/m.11836 type:complete len:118 (-) Transcript_11860:168-521(-)